MPILAESEARRDITATRDFFTGCCEPHEGPPKSSQTRAEERKANTLTENLLLLCSFLSMFYSVQTVYCFTGEQGLFPLKLQ